MATIDTTLDSNTKKTPEKIEPYSDQYYRMRNALLSDFVTTKPCRDCGAPVISGYCCTRCGSTLP